MKKCIALLLAPCVATAWTLAYTKPVSADRNHDPPENAIVLNAEEIKPDRDKGVLDQDRPVVRLKNDDQALRTSRLWRAHYRAIREYRLTPTDQACWPSGQRHEYILRGWIKGRSAFL